MAEYIQTKEPCKNCVHKKACEAWMRYLKTIYDDNDYSTCNCPYYLSFSDVAQVQHGQWAFENTWYCSCCHKHWALTSGTPQGYGMKYCPNCGAIMDGAEDDG